MAYECYYKNNNHTSGLVKLNKQNSQLNVFLKKNLYVFHQTM